MSHSGNQVAGLTPDTSKKKKGLKSSLQIPPHLSSNTLPHWLLNIYQPHKNTTYLHTNKQLEDRLVGIVSTVHTELQCMFYRFPMSYQIYCQKVLLSFLACHYESERSKGNAKQQLKRDGKYCLFFSKYFSKIVCSFRHAMNLPALSMKSLVVPACPTDPTELICFDLPPFPPWLGCM